MDMNRFWMGMGIGMAAGSALGLMANPRRKNDGALLGLHIVNRPDRVQDGAEDLLFKISHEFSSMIGANKETW